MLVAMGLERFSRPSEKASTTILPEEAKGIGMVEEGVAVAIVTAVAYLDTEAALEKGP